MEVTLAERVQREAIERQGRISREFQASLCHAERERIQVEKQFAAALIAARNENAADLANSVAETLEAGRAGVLLLVESDGRERFIQIGFAKE